MKKLMLILICVLCCMTAKAGVTVELTDEGATLTSDPSATGYALDYDYENYTYDGTFDRYCGTNPKHVLGGPRIWNDDDVRVGLPSWVEARGVVEFRTSYVPNQVYVYEYGDDPRNEEPQYTLYLDKVYLRRYWFSGTNTDSRTSLYGYAGDGYMGASDIFETDLLLEDNIGRYGSIDVTDFIKDLKNNNSSYAGFVLKETRNGALLNYGSFYLDAYYIPEPTTVLLLAFGIIYLKYTKI